MNNHTKNQHYVPRFLLKNFASREGVYIWAYDRAQKYKQQDIIKERAIKTVASEDYFYDQHGVLGKQTYEYSIGKIETEASLIFEKIIISKNIENLTEEERTAISYFIITQYFRTKGRLIETGKSMKMLSKKLAEKSMLKIPDIDPTDIWFSTLGQSLSFYKLIMNKVWALAESNNSFLLSDDPVTLQNSTNEGKIVGAMGLDSYGIEIYMPICPSLTLCFFSESLLAEKGYHKNFLPNSKCEPEEVVNLNFLQIASSERFIFSHINEFEHVKQLGHKFKY